MTLVLSPGDQLILNVVRKALYDTSGRPEANKESRKTVIVRSVQPNGSVMVQSGQSIFKISASGKVMTGEKIRYEILSIQLRA